MYTLRITLQIDPLVLAEAAGLTLDDVYVALKQEPVDVYAAEAIVNACNQLYISGRNHVYTLESLFTFRRCSFYS